LNDPTRFVVKVRKSIDKEIDPHLKDVFKKCPAWMS